MKIISDLHIHSRFARGCSTQINIENLEKYARIKGLGLLGTGDFTHPLWNKELKENLKEEDGILKTKTGFPFILQTEISLIYSEAGKGRRIHNVILAPSFEVVDQIIEALLKRGRLDYDGRPIFGIPCPEFVKMMRSISKDIEIIPAHIWTPHFSLFGDYNQYSSVEDCFHDQTKHIHAMETGLSSDPEMNWRFSQLDKYQLVSFSDLHSFWPWRIGREATIFDIKLSYDNLLKAIRTGEGLIETIEFWPHEGKYHFDGHRNCNVCMEPSEAIKNNNICPVCRRELTIGVAHRVEELADREEGFKPKTAKPFRNIIPLSELISGVLKKGVATQAVWKEYNKLIEAFENEFNIIFNVSEADLLKVVSEPIAKIIIKNREQEIKFRPGYDGVYGVPLFDEKEKIDVKTSKPSQKTLADF